MKRIMHKMLVLGIAAAALVFVNVAPIRAQELRGAIRSAIAPYDYDTLACCG